MSGPTSKLFVAMVVGLAVLLLVATVAAVPRLRGRKRYAVQAVSVLATSLSLTLAIAVLVNASQGWFLSWQDVFGSDDSSQQPPPVLQTPATPHPVATDRAAVAWTQKPTALQAAPERNSALGRPTLTGGAQGDWIKVQIPGPVSGVKRPALVWLPPSYRTAPDRFYPVILAFGGYPGTMEDIRGPMQLGQQVARAVSNKQMREPIIVVPEVFAGKKDTECVDATVGGGELMESWLSIDVAAWIQTNLRVADSPGAWATFGFSAGGYCASMLTVRHPDLVGNVISLSGYWSLEFDGRSQTSLSDPRYKLVSLLATRPRINIYGYSGSLDERPLRELKAVAAAAKFPTTVTTQIRPNLGHSFEQWPQATPAALIWLGKTSVWFAPLPGR